MSAAPTLTSAVRARLEAATAELTPRRFGHVTAVDTDGITVGGLTLPLGSSVRIDTSAGTTLVGEVTAVRTDEVLVAPLDPTTGVAAGDRVAPAAASNLIPVGHGLLGRVIDSLGAPLDDLGTIDAAELVSIHNTPANPMTRKMVTEPLQLGVRALDAMTPIGVGQRVALMAGSGVGKSSLLSMVTRGTTADVVVCVLVGERNRELAEFIHNDLGPEGLARAVVVVETSDRPALRRMRAAYAGTRIAEWFRDQGLNVLLLMDSVTRFCHAQRDIALASGAVPSRGGYPPSMPSTLAGLLERAGCGSTGAITGIYTVLVDGDDLTEPVADAVRSILDGHVVLTRRLADAGHYPPIDVLGSVSRCATAITSAEDRATAQAARRLLATYAEKKDFVDAGAYRNAMPAEVAAALAAHAELSPVLQQGISEVSTIDEARAAVAAAIAAHRS